MGEGQALHNSTWILAAAMLLAGTTLHAQPVEPASTSQVRILATASPCASRHRPGMAWISWLVPVVAVPNIACSLLGFASVVAMVDAGAPYP
jgi:phosphoribosylcarboxyaminoimidazole (NCAIR) mutase